MAGKRRYLDFCQRMSLSPLPTTKKKLVSFVAFTTQQGLKHQTIKCYLVAIGHLQIDCGGATPELKACPCCPCPYGERSENRQEWKSGLVSR